MTNSLRLSQASRVGRSPASGRYITLPLSRPSPLARIRIHSSQIKAAFPDRSRCVSHP